MKKIIPANVLIIDLLAVLFFTVLLIWVYLSSPGEALDYLFAERGPFEIASFLLWFLLAAVVILIVRPLDAITFSLAGLAAIAGFRELDFHNAFTQESISRISYYLNPHIPILERVLVGALVLCIALVSMTLVFRFGKWLLRDRGYAHPAGQIALLAIVLVPATKILDRLPAYIRGFVGISLNQDTVIFFSVIEEGFEMLLPLLFLQVVFLLQKNSIETPAAVLKRHRIF